MSTKTKKPDASAKYVGHNDECPACYSRDLVIAGLRNRIATLEIERDNAQQSAWASMEEVRRIRSGRGI